jgi:hypothetical protein
MQQSAPTPVRRQFERSSVKAHAFIHRGPHFQHAQIVDYYSQGGLQPEGTFGLIRQDPIQVEPISGIRAHAKLPGHWERTRGLFFPSLYKLPTQQSLSLPDACANH